MKTIEEKIDKLTELVHSLERDLATAINDTGACIKILDERVKEIEKLGSSDVE